jgi:hypothetical protein
MFLCCGAVLESETGGNTASDAPNVLEFQGIDLLAFTRTLLLDGENAIASRRNCATD